MVLIGTVVSLLATVVPPVHAEAVPEPASAFDIAAQVGLYQVTKSWSANVGDFDADGDADLMYVPHNESASKLYRNDGGLFSEVFPGTFRRRDRHDCAWGDVNIDGRLDLYCSLGASSGTATNPKELWIQQTGGGFVDQAAAFGVTDPYGRGRVATFVDVNHDPYPDLFVGNQYPRQDGIPVPNHLLINQGGTSFAAAPEFGIDVEVGGMCAQAADIDRDGWEDLLVCGQTGLHLYRNDGGTGFVEITGAWGVGSLTSGLHSARLADLTGDGKLDLALVTQTSLVVLPQGASSFGPMSFRFTLKAGRWVAVGDFQGDGALDLFVVQKCRNGINDPDYLLLGDGTGVSFSEVALPQTSQGCGDIAEPIDHDGDGDDEFIVLNGLGYTAQGPVQLIASGPSTTACTVTGSAAGEHLLGTPADDVICGYGGNDTLEGFGGNDLLLGGDGNDTLRGGPGADDLDGEAGTDLGDYADQSVGIVVSLDGLANDGSPGENDDVATSVENVTGGSGADVLTGSAAANTLIGGLGDDSLMGGGANDTLNPGAGNDQVAGDDGRDIVQFSSLSQAVTVDLAAGTASGQGEDTVMTVESVQGSPAADTITGASGSETLNGLGGPDRVTGSGGADTLIGGGGADTLLGVDGIQGNDKLDGKTGTDSCSADPMDIIVACP